MENIEKPTTIAREEFITNLVNLINESGLPAFVMEPILHNMLNEVQAIMNEQYEKDLEQYNLALQQGSMINETNEE